MKRLSIIIPGYNTPDAWWERCLRSVLAACGPEDEILCVDDGSARRPLGGLGDAPSSTPLHFYTANPPPIKWIYLEKNSGPGAARNAALAVATGDYVTFVDSDDEIELETVSRCKAALAATEADVAIYGVKVVWPEDGIQKTDTFEREEALEALTPQKVFDLHRRCLLNYSCNKVYRASFLKEHGLKFNPEGMPCEDIIFNLGCIMAGAKFCTVPYAGYVYYRTRGTLLSKYKKTSSVGTHLASDIWRKYKEATPGARECLGDLGEVSEAQELRAEWKNIWMPGSPYGLWARWRWLKVHPEIGGAKAYLKMAVFMFLRRHFYFRPVRRWNTKRQYPYAVEWAVDKKPCRGVEEEKGNGRVEV